MTREQRSIAHLTARSAWISGLIAGPLGACLAGPLSCLVGDPWPLREAVFVAVLSTILFPLTLLGMREVVRRRAATSP